MADEKGKILKLLKLDKLLENLTGYIETRIELIKLDLREQAEETITGVLQSLVIIVLSMIILLFLSLGLAIGINLYIKSSIIGYLIVALLYLVMLVFVLLDKNKRLARWFLNKFIHD